MKSRTGRNSFAWPAIRANWAYVRLAGGRSPARLAGGGTMEIWPAVGVH